MIRERPYFFENNNPAYVWVCDIYKKSLISLGINIIKSELGGRIGHFDTTSWCFLIDKNDWSKIEEAYKE